MKKAAFALLVLLSFSAVSETFAQTRIRFARGRTSASVRGTISSLGAKSYVLGAYSGQYLTANVSSARGCIEFNNGSTSTSFTTVSGNNWIRLLNRCRGSISFTMTLSIQ
jgi:hypothetical protein